MTAVTSIKVSFFEMDNMFIVHHSNYLKWFEIGRRDYLRKAGIPLSYINRQGFFLPLSEMECKFKSPAKYGDELILITRIASMSCAKVMFEYSIINKSNGNTIATGKTVHAWTDKDIKPLNMEKAAPHIYALLKEYTQE